jgi:hypothetical protein
MVKQYYINIQKEGAGLRAVNPCSKHNKVSTPTSNTFTAQSRSEPSDILYVQTCCTSGLVG